VVDGYFLVYPYPYTGPPITFRLEEIGEADFTGYLGQFWAPRMATLMPNLRRAKFPSSLWNEVSVENTLQYSEPGKWNCVGHNNYVAFTNTFGENPLNLFLDKHNGCQRNFCRRMQTFANPAQRQ
jgi:hypothetical protein